MTALAPAAVVVRAGIIRDPDVLMQKVQSNIDHGGECALSVFAMNPVTDEPQEGTVARIVADAKFSHKKMQLSTYEQLEKMGFSLTWDTSNGQAQCHYNVYLDEPLQRKQVEDFISCFSEPQQRPEQE